MLLARRERHVVTTAELRAVGCSRDRIRHLQRKGWITREFHGVYLVGRAQATPDERERAAVKACGPDAVLSHRSAGVRWGVLREHRGPVEVTLPTQRARRRGLRTYKASLDPRDVTTKDGVPVTTLARTLVDLAMVLHPDALDVAVHEAENLRRLRVAAVEAAMARAGARRRGRPALRRSLRRHGPGAAGLKHDLERKFHRFLRRHRFPQAEHNVLLELDDGQRIEADVLFRSARLVVELDAGPHATTRNFHSDRRRDRRLGASHDVLTVRVTHRDIDEDETTLAADLLTLLERRCA